MSRTKGARNKPKEVIADLTGTAPRLPYPPDIAQRFGFDALQWKVLVEAILPDAKTAHAVIRVLSYCKTCADANRTHGPVVSGSPTMDADREVEIEEARDGEPPQRARDPGPTDPGPQPHTIPGKNESCESWAEKYTDLLRTSETIAQANLWRTLNAQPIALLTMRKPSVGASVRKITEEVLQALTDEEATRAARKAKTAPVEPEATV